jgi:hypothetical protein
VDLASFPTRDLLRWDLAVRLLLAALIPLLAQVWLGDGVVGPGLVAGLVAALVSMASLGPDLAAPRWLLLAALATPTAVVSGAALGLASPWASAFVFVLYVAQGVAIEAGLVTQLAWFPVSTAGMLAAALTTGHVDVGPLAAAACAGAAWAALLMVVVGRVPTPRLDLPAAALRVDTAAMRRLVTHPSLRGWVFPVLLGGLSVLLIVVAGHLTEGYRPYWAVFALVSVLAPTAAATRRSAWEVVASSLAGIALAAVLLWSGLGPVALFATSLGLGIVGAALILRAGMLSKTLLTPLPVVIAGLALSSQPERALGARLLEYLLGAGVGLVAAVVAQWLVRRLEADRPDAEAAVVA